MKQPSVEIIRNDDGSYSLRVYDTIVITGTFAACQAAAAFE